MEGIRRARDQIAKADAVLWLSDDSQDPDDLEFEPTEWPGSDSGDLGP